MREALRPAYRLGCKRVLISNRYYPALTQPNVTLVPARGHGARARIRLLAADGVERPAERDRRRHRLPRDRLAGHRGRIRGRDGRTLAEHWNGSPQALQAAPTIAGFPNLFMLLGPHTGLGHTSVLLMIESQIDYVLGALRAMDERRIEALEPRRRCPGGVRGRGAPAGARDGLGERRLRELVSGSRRALGALARLGAAIPPSAAPLRPRELPRAAVQFELAHEQSRSRPIEAPRTRTCRRCAVEINAASARCPYCGARQLKHQPILGWRGAARVPGRSSPPPCSSRAQIVIARQQQYLRYVPYPQLRPRGARARRATRTSA